VIEKNVKMGKLAYDLIKRKRRIKKHQKEKEPNS